MMKNPFPLRHLLVLSFTLLAGGAGAQTLAADQRPGGSSFEPPAGMNGWRATARIGMGSFEPPLGMNGWTAPLRLPLATTSAARAGLGGQVPPCGSNGWVRAGFALPRTAAL